MMDFAVNFSGTEEYIDVQTEISGHDFAPEFGAMHTVNSGQNGATFFPAVSESGVISWTNDRGLENPTPVNIKGPVGPDGKTPVKGTDYFTETDKAEMVAAVIAELPVYSGEYEITPLTSSDIEMLTAKTFMDANVRIKKILYAEVQNNSGGITATIGE